MHASMCVVSHWFQTRPERTPNAAAATPVTNPRFVATDWYKWKATFAIKLYRVMAQPDFREVAPEFNATRT